MSARHTHRLLVVDDEPDLLTLYELTLLREGYQVETANCIEDAWALLQANTYALVITDMRLPDGSGLDLLQRLEAASRAEKAIVITAYGSAENAVTALKAGAFDYLTKPVDLKQFRAVVAAGLGGAGDAASGTSPRQATTNRAGVASVAQTPALARLIGSGAAMTAVKALIAKVSHSMAPVLILGESGTGKELVARAIHDSSGRAQRPFIAVNCSAIPEQLLEAEFFGFRKGTFTGANEDRAGFFQAAHGGTLFLDEIGDLPLAMQSKLLRAIQERAVRAVGATHESAVDVRILSATHRDLLSEVSQQRFRQDLYYRLNVIRIELPPLRERMQDLPDLCTQLLSRIAAESKLEATPTISPQALALLGQQRFEGNVRELENLLHRAVALSGHLMLQADDLGLATSGAAGLPQAAELQALAQRSSAHEEAVAATSIAASGPARNRVRESAVLPADLVAHLDAIEREILVQALEQHRLNRTAAGASLGLSLRQMRYRMARLGVLVTEQGVTLGERFDPESEGE